MKHLKTALTVLCLLASALPARGDEPAPEPKDSVEPKAVFAFAGHLRGAENFRLHPLLKDLVKDLSLVRADFLAIGGDTICGYTTAYDEPALEREWQLVDEELSGLTIPVWRVTGNHDWHSEETARVWRRRYGREFYFHDLKGVRVIGLNVTRLVPDRSLDWGRIWHEDRYLPNDLVLPDGEQLALWEEALAGAADPSVGAVVVLAGGRVWEDEGTASGWWRDFHPMLERLGKPVVVLSGEVQPPAEPVLRRGNVVYASSALGIMDPDQGFSIGQGSYLQVAFRGADYAPDLTLRSIGFGPDRRPRILASLPRDTDAYFKYSGRLARGEEVSLLNRLRTRIKRWTLDHVDWYDRSFDLAVLAAVAAGASVLVLLGLWAARHRR